MSIGKRIKECRQNRKLSQEKLAELLGVSRQAVTKWESDLSAPNTENLFALAEVLGTSVDYLASTDTSCSVSKQVYRLHQENVQKQRQELRARTIGNLKVAGLVLLSYLVLFLLGKLIWYYPVSVSVLGWFLDTAPTGHAYLFGWLLAGGLFPVCTIISTAPALFGKHRFSFVTVSAFALGLPLGEYLGANPQGNSYGFGHYGWAIWGGVFLFGAIMGIWLQRFPKEALTPRNRKFRIFCLTALAGTLLIVILVRSSMFVPPVSG